MELADLVGAIPGFHTRPGTEQIAIFAWYVHEHKKQETFDPANIKACYRMVHVEAPNLSQYLKRMVERKPAVLLIERGRYRLSGATRRQLGAKYGDHPTTVITTNTLKGLPEQLADAGERAFLLETMNCYRVGAFRAAIVMAWNLAYEHLIDWIIADLSRLQAFNQAIPKKYPNMKLQISQRDDFERIKESETIEVCNVARLTSKSVIKVLSQKLDRRNIAAHPSTVVHTQSQADDVITDLVNNVVLRLN